MFNALVNFWDFVWRDPSLIDCWIWTGVRHQRGYGVVRMNGKSVRAPRLSLMLFRFEGREIPSEMQVLHTCDNPSCVNPEHLFLGTHADNMADKKAKNRQSRTGNGFNRKTHCPKGHPYNEENTIHWKTYRYCRICSREHKRAYKKRYRNLLGV